MSKYYFLTLILFLFAGNFLNSQSLLSDNFNAKGTGNVIASYTSKQYSEFWAGTNLMDAPNEGLNQSIYSLYAQYALTNKLEIVANIPYISNVAKNDIEAFNGIQNISLFLKGQVFQVNKFSGGLAGGTNIATGYEPAGLYSIGNGSTSLEGWAILHYQFPAGISLGVQGGYTQNFEDFVPNATMFQSRLSYSNDFLFLSATYGLQRSTDGLDIGSGAFMAPRDFPHTKVDYDQIVFSAYVPIAGLIAATAYYGSVLSGRNIGNASFFGVGVALKL